MSKNNKLYLVQVFYIPNEINEILLVKLNPEIFSEGCSHIKALNLSVGIHHFVVIMVRNHIMMDANKQHEADLIKKQFHFNNCFDKIYRINILFKHLISHNKLIIFSNLLII